MEWADEPLPPVLLYRVGLGGWGNRKRSETRRMEARGRNDLKIMLLISTSK